MTTQDRVQAVADYGFTDRQAKFLILVMRHSGLCIKRQYGAFAGISRAGTRVTPSSRGWCGAGLP